MESKSDIKDLFRTAKRLLNWTNESQYPNDVSVDLWQDSQNESINENIVKEAIEEEADTKLAKYTLDTFEPATEEKI